MDLKTNISGLDDVVSAMARLPRSVRNRVLRPALRAGGEVVKSAAAQNVRRVAIKGYSTGRLARSLIVRQGRNVGGAMRVIVAIAPRKTYPDGTRVGLVGSVLEHGRRAGQGGNLSTQDPQPWLRPAARDSETQVYSVVFNEGQRRFYAAVSEATR